MNNPAAININVSHGVWTHSVRSVDLPDHEMNGLAWSVQNVDKKEDSKNSLTYRLDYPHRV